MNAIATTIFTKCFNKFFDFLCELPSKFSRNKHVLITQEHKDELALCMRLATRSIRYALKHHNGKLQLKFKHGGEIDALSISYWLYDEFLEAYYGVLSKEIKQHIENIHELINSLDRFYSYSYSFDDNSADSAYSLRYQQRYNHSSEHITKSQKIADETFEITLPQLLNTYIELTKLLIKINLIDK